MPRQRITLDMSDSDQANKLSGRRTVWVRGAVAGLVATGVSLGVAELVRAMNSELSSPIIDVGARFIDATPRWLKDFAISTFGTNDKTALVVGIATVLVVYALTLGVFGTRRRWIGVAGVAIFAAIGIAASSGQSGPWWGGLPSLIGGAAGAAALWYLLGLAVNTEQARTEWADSRSFDTETPGSSASVGPAVATGNPEGRKVMPGRLDRRSFMAASAGFSAVAVLAGSTGRWLSGRFEVAAERARIILPGARRPLGELPADVKLDVAGLTPFVTDNSNFYRIDTALVAPQVSSESWRLKVHGMVDKTLEFSYDELLRRDLVESDITIACVSNEIGGGLAGNARWLGVPLSELLEEAGVDPAADQIVGRSVDGFTAGFPTKFGVDPDRGSLLALGMNGEPLPVKHGFPARLIVPGLYGYVSATKWITEIELSTFDRFDAYWVEREWSVEGPIKTFSRIDTPASFKKLAPGEHPIAGIAYAPTRGISKVEVRVDGQDWIPASLGKELNDVTWRQWVLPYDFKDPGQYSIECRATDGSGVVQTQERAKPFPNGASGWHSIVALIE
ncbi:MAG: molybdopterin-dependent oxidoreductase [Microthrixaceae bacterium]